MDTKEILSFHIGQAGVHIGEEFWRLLDAERKSATDKTSAQDPNENFNSLFYLNREKKHLARALFVDYDAGVINRVKKGSMSEVLTHFISGKEDTGGLFTRGYYSLYTDIREPLEDKIRKMAESADKLEGFIFTTSISGGTGPALTVRILELLKQEFDKTPKLVFNLSPSPRKSTSIIEPFNAIYGIKEIPSHCDLNIIFDNEALYNYSEENLGDSLPNFTDVNNIIAQAMSTLVLSMRKTGDLNVNIRDILTNLVPFPSVNTALLSMANQPLNSDMHGITSSHTTESLTLGSYQKESSLSSIDNKKGKYIASNLIFRGQKLSIGEVLETARLLKPVLFKHFAEFSPSGLKVGLHRSESLYQFKERLYKHKATVCNVLNTTALKNYFLNLKKKTDGFYRYRSYFHWFLGEGIENCEMTSLFMNLQCQISDYKDLEAETCEKLKKINL